MPCPHAENVEVKCKRSSYTEAPGNIDYEQLPTHENHTTAVIVANTTDWHYIGAVGRGLQDVGGCHALFKMTETFELAQHDQISVNSVKDSRFIL